jgi:hypothetical protein
MVPGELRTHTPCFVDSPLLDLTCPSYPIGKDMNNPVFIIVLSSGLIVMSLLVNAFRSIPAEDSLS